jgi:hypothetical protein
MSVIAVKSASGAEMSVMSDARVVTSAAKAATNVARRRPAGPKGHTFVATAVSKCQVGSLPVIMRVLARTDYGSALYPEQSLGESVPAPTNRKRNK